MNDGPRPNGLNEREMTLEQKLRQREKNKAYYTTNRERLLAKANAWHAVNPEVIKVRNKAQRTANRERENARSRAYHAANREQHNEISKAWKAANPDRCKNYNLANRNRINERRKRWRKANRERLKYANWTSSQKLIFLYRIRINKLLKDRKSTRTCRLLGCDVQWLIAWLEIQFQPGMNWNNYGPIWHLDHKRPCASFDLNIPQEQKLCFHWSNLQPLFAAENLSKQHKWQKAA